MIIKYRVFDTVTNEMHYPEEEKECRFRLCQHGDLYDENNPNAGDCVSYRSIPMLYIGLHDKNGKEIYDGDVISDYNGFTYVVKWEEIHSGFSPFTDIDCNGDYDIWTQNAEVIGNIYQ